MANASRPSPAVSHGSTATTLDTEFHRGLGLYDSTMVVVGSMIGSGIFIVSADMARNIGSPGWLLGAWILTGALTVVGALSYGELAAMMPRAGGQYVYLREAFSPLWGFLYGWTLFLVIQTGTIAAVSVGFARYFGALVPWIADDNYLIPPLHLSSGYALSLSTTQLSSKGQVVIPEEIRTRLGLKPGDRFVVVGQRGVVIFKSIDAPDLEEFDALVAKARRQARKAALRRSHIVSAVRRARA